MEGLMLSALFNPWWVLIPAIIVAVIGVGRLTRVITYDDFPPAVAFRIWWSRITKDGPWAKLVHCAWCLSPWIMAIAVGWYLIGAFFASWLLIAWWIFWGWLTLSYLAAQYVFFDEGKPDAE
jgi:hypothetical protein